MADKPNRKQMFNAKPRGKHGKDKLPPKHPDIVAYMAQKAISGKVFEAIPKRLLQTIFMKTAVIPLANAGLLIDTGKLTFSADGTCIISHASPYGRKTCDCDGKCSFPRNFADPQAEWGWDSYHDQ